MLKFWIVTEVHDYGCDLILGVYLTETAAKAAWRGDWRKYNQSGSIQSSRNRRLMPKKFSTRGMNSFQKLALQILRGDPMALDLARDVLKC